MSQNNPLRALLDKQDILLLDGAMATELEARGCNCSAAIFFAQKRDKFCTVGRCQKDTFCTVQK